MYDLGKFSKSYRTPVSKQVRPDQTQNEAGGYVFQASDWDRFERFLILGVVGDTLYMGKEQQLDESLGLLVGLAKSGMALRMLERAAAVSTSGVALKNEPAIVVLAVVMAQFPRLAEDYVLTICRTGTHILHLASYVDRLRGGSWGRAIRRAIGKWYTSQPVDKVAFQVAKYQNRDGWTHKDVLRLSHVSPGLSEDRQALFTWIVKGETSTETPEVILGMEAAKIASEPSTIVGLIDKCNLSREMLPTKFLTEREVIEALIDGMPATALLRNLGNYAAAGLHEPGQKVREVTIARLTDVEYLKRNRVHPLQVAVAARMYNRGAGLLGHKTWDASGKVQDALDEAFELSFTTANRTGKRFIVAVDVSGSMRGADAVPGVLSAAQAAALMAYSILRLEETTLITFDTQAKEATFGKRTGITSVMDAFNERGGGTDISSVFRYAHQRKLQADAIVVLTDMQTWAGPHPFQELERYRKMAGPVKVVTACVTPNRHTIKPPDDPLTLDTVGFEADLLNVVQTFINL
jgi:60 kDa SS-A/Ro ribonucleoprotein